MDSTRKTNLDAHDAANRNREAADRLLAGQAEDHSTSDQVEYTDADPLGEFSDDDLGRLTASAIIDQVVNSISILQTAIHVNAVHKGFWPDDRNIPEAMALIHSEISEALEAYRSGNPPDDHLPEFDGVTVELADAVIRILDLAGGLDLRVAEAIAAKMEYNTKRPHKHGREF